MPYSLEQLDQMSLETAQALPFEERDALLDLIIQDGRNQASHETSFRTGLYGDYFEEDIIRMLKVRAVRVLPRGVTPLGLTGQQRSTNQIEEYREAFENMKEVLEAAGTSFLRVVSLVIYLTDMSQWGNMNKVYQEFVSNPPCRAVIGTTGLAGHQSIEIVSVIAYKVMP